jgi:glycosyltransferase involved in cell wall biosynthesis
VLVIDGVIRRVIEEADGGVFVQPGDATALAQAVLHISQNPERLMEMGKNARQYLVQHLDRREKLAETLHLFEKLVQK